MTKFLLVGAGGHASVVIDIIHLLHPTASISCLTDDPSSSTVDSDVTRVIGPLSLAFTRELFQSFDYAFVAIGNSQRRLDIFSRLADYGYSLQPLIHPSAVISPSASIGPSTLVCANAVVQPNVQIGSAVIINTSSSVDHHSFISDGVHIAPGAHLAGNVHIGISSFVGIGSSVIQGVSIGNNAVIGSGATVIRDVACNAVVAGVPAKPL